MCDTAGPVKGRPGDDAEGGDERVAESTAGTRFAADSQTHDHARQVEVVAEHAVRNPFAKAFQVGATGVGGGGVRELLN